MKGLVLGMLLAIKASTSLAIAGGYPWEGSWTSADDSNLEYCFTFSTQEVRGYEWRCDIKSVQALPPKSSWALQLKCEGEGDEWKTSEIVILHEAHLTLYQEMTWPPEGGEDAKTEYALETYERCK